MSSEIVRIVSQQFEESRDRIGPANGRDRPNQGSRLFLSRGRRLSEQPNRRAADAGANRIQLWHDFVTLRGLTNAGAVVAVFRSLFDGAADGVRGDAWRILLEADPPDDVVLTIAEQLGGNGSPRKAAPSARTFSQSILVAAGHVEVTDDRVRWSPRDITRKFAELRWEAPKNVSHLLKKLRERALVEYRKTGADARNWRLSDDGRVQSTRLGGPVFDPPGDVVDDEDERRPETR